MPNADTESVAVLRKPCMAWQQGSRAAKITNFLGHGPLPQNLDSQVLTLEMFMRKAF